MNEFYKALQALDSRLNDLDGRLVQGGLNLEKHLVDYQSQQTTQEQRVAILENQQPFIVDKIKELETQVHKHSGHFDVFNQSHGTMKNRIDSIDAKLATLDAWGDRVAQPAVAPVVQQSYAMPVQAPSTPTAQSFGIASPAQEQTYRHIVDGRVVQLSRQ